MQAFSKIEHKTWLASSEIVLASTQVSRSQRESGRTTAPAMTKSLGLKHCLAKNKQGMDMRSTNQLQRQRPMPNEFVAVFGDGLVPSRNERGKEMAKNLCAKTRPVSDPYEVWKNNQGWTWLVLKKYQADDNKPYARWFCSVTSPYTQGLSDMGDAYVAEVRRNASLVEVNY